MAATSSVPDHRSGRTTGVTGRTTGTGSVSSPEASGRPAAAHAHAAGEALARLHLAAEGFDAPRRQVQPLVASFTVFASTDPETELERHVEERPQLAKGLAEFPWREDTRRVLLPLYEELAPHLPGLTPLWTHNDWHASNLLWNEDGSVATALDFGMSDRTTAVHDLATAIERNAVQWLQPDFPVREEERWHFWTATGPYARSAPPSRRRSPRYSPWSTPSSRSPSWATSTA
ncbi:aminoglycoside phosphotransferase family protein [Streptomyces galilaeus]